MSNKVTISTRQKPSPSIKRWWWGATFGCMVAVAAFAGVRLQQPSLPVGPKTLGICTIDSASLDLQVFTEVPDQVHVIIRHYGKNKVFAVDKIMPVSPINNRLSIPLEALPDGNYLLEAAVGTRRMIRFFRHKNSPNNF